MPPLTPANQAIRARNVSASECGALLGEHPFVTPAMIWDRLNHPQDQRQPNEAMYLGSLLEPVLLGIARDRLRVPIRFNSRTYQHPRVRLCATPDALVLPQGGQYEWTVGRALVELKASSGMNLRFGKTLPPDIEWQCRAQLACTHRDRVVVIVLAGLKIREYVVERHMGKERRLTRAVEAFWADHVLTGQRPLELAEPSEAIAYRKGKSA